MTSFISHFIFFYILYLTKIVLMAIVTVSYIYFVGCFILNPGDIFSKKMTHDDMF